MFEICHWDIYYAIALYKLGADDFNKEFPGYQAILTKYLNDSQLTQFLRGSEEHKHNKGKLVFIMLLYDYIVILKSHNGFMNKDTIIFLFLQGRVLSPSKYTATEDHLSLRMDGMPITYLENITCTHVIILGTRFIKKQTLSIL